MFFVVEGIWGGAWGNSLWVFAGISVRCAFQVSGDIQGCRGKLPSSSKYFDNNCVFLCWITPGVPMWGEIEFVGDMDVFELYVVWKNFY